MPKIIFRAAHGAGAMSYWVGKLIVCLAVMSGTVSFSQNRSADAVIYQTILNTAGKDIGRALHMADSLYIVSEEPIARVKSLMLLADLNLATGKKTAAMDYAFNAERIAAGNDLFEWQARIYGFISTHYRTIGLMQQSKTYLNKGLEAINKVDQPHIVNQYKGLAYQELALFEIDSKNYDEAVGYLKKAVPYLQQIKTKEVRLYQLATNYGQLGRAYMYLEDTKTAVAHFNKALGLLSGIDREATVVKGFMYEGIGRAFLENGDFDKSLTYLNKALEIADNSDDMSLQEEVYCDLAIYYLETGDKDKYKQYNKAYLAALQNAARSNRNSLARVVNRLQEREKELSKKHDIMFSGFSLVALCLVTVVWVNKNKRKKDYKRFLEIIERVKEQSQPQIMPAPHPVPVKDEESEKELMSREAEQSILGKLAVFEQGNTYTSKSINLSKLSVMLETNSKYLSYVINKHKKKDFNSYINELRIYYIIKKLEASPEYLNYKISYLADECGFSSHSKFTDKFKTVTGMSPSSFIQFLNKKSQERVA